MSTEQLKKTPKILISNASDSNVISLLQESDNEVILLPNYDKLPLPVASHADMLFFKYGNKLFCFAEYLENNKDIFDRYSVALSPIAQTPTAIYPNDILLNSVIFREGTKDAFILGNENFMSRDLKSLPERKVSVKQGYAHCSCCVIGEDSVITSDTGIAEACRKNNIDTLLISPGRIVLEGYDTGFIGGASGVIGDTLYFFGNPYTHIDGEMIVNFIERKISEGKTFVKKIKYTDGLLRDYGGLVVLP